MISCPYIGSDGHNVLDVEGPFDTRAARFIGARDGGDAAVGSGVVSAEEAAQVIEVDAIVQESRHLAMGWVWEWDGSGNGMVWEWG